MGAAGRRFDAKVRIERGFTRLIGVDEAGRGPLAGPVVAAAVLIGPELPRGLSAVRDSKLLTPAAREKLLEKLRKAGVKLAVAWAHPREIERLNILQASLQCMRRAALRLQTDDALVVVDGNRKIPKFTLPQLTVVDGDRRSFAVGCASIVAKVVRDRWMERLDRRHPGYGLARHKGYGTAAHLEALSRLGPSSIHRRTYAPVAALAGKELEEVLG
jgi:ribonuclease HII